MADVQFNRYNNIVTFAKDWRKYKLTNKPLDANAFRMAIQSDQYVLLECRDTKRNRDVLIYLFEKNSKYSTSSQDLKRLLKKIKNPCDVILITYAPFNTYGKKAIASYKHLNTYTYLHEIFELVLPNGPLCYPHRILSRDEVLQLCNEELFCYLTNLPKIFDEDPQCIWIGAESGDVVEIKMLSDTSGEVIHYRVVVPKSGRVIFSKEESTDELAKDATPGTEPSEDVDEELEEHRELNTNEDLYEDASDAEQQDHENEEHIEDD
jgi:DNA-directed RNA polymerase subunit H (RpoH/RPB5)